MLFYSGIGSRKTPKEILTQMSRLARRLAELGFILRSGAADGADSAFEVGALSGNGRTEIYLPWPRFNDHSNGIVATSRQMDRAGDLAKSLHPNWENLSQGAKKLHSRNCFQLLGLQLSEPSRFVLCWTPDGCVGKSSRTSKSGGTATAIVLAESQGVPVFNMASFDWLPKLTELVEQLKTEHKLHGLEVAKK